MALSVAMVLSGLEKEHFCDGLHDIFDRGSALLKSPSTSSITSSDTTESGISSMSSDSNPVKSLVPYFDLLSRINQDFDSKKDDEPLYFESQRPIQIFYKNRNILDLGNNTKWDQWTFKPAQLEKGIQYFFDNRSQFSRVQDVSIPKHYMVQCGVDDCNFNEPHYF